MIIVIEVEVERVEGKFVSKDELAEALCEDIENGGDITVDDSTYAIVSALQGRLPEEIKKAMIRPELERLLRATKRRAHA